MQNLSRIVVACISVLALAGATSGQEATRPKAVQAKTAVRVAQKSKNEEAKGAEAGIERKFTSLQRRLAAEEAKLQARFEELGKRRTVALEKADEKLLKRIEATEKAAVKQYEQKIQMLLSSAERGTATASKAMKRTVAPLTRNIPGGSSAKSQPNRTPQPRRRMRLWPFK